MKMVNPKLPFLSANNALVFGIIWLGCFLGRLDAQATTDPSEGVLNVTSPKWPGKRDVVGFS
ncbi:hypothetical protein QJS04_geneDACA024879 [Acorus gramineus]|uniref:Uncharacterized protein n=1 Tax=Acorus gramineus TaxID=55184 RepID=A0AAV9A1J1_ACOGR|nr:hypothetical protein QJS04_geneDACA024879 [Acorus gramineus]